MKCRWMLIPVLCIGCLLLRADEFEDLIQECARVSRNYNRAVSAPNTRYDKEFRTYLDNLKHQSVAVQAVIRKLDLGLDFNFPMLVNELEMIYQDMKEQNKSSDGLSGAKSHRPKNSSNRNRSLSGAKLTVHSTSPEGLLKILTADVVALRKMGFTTENGGSIKSSMETRRKLMEFQRLVDFFRKFYSSAWNENQKNDISVERFFSVRRQRMLSLSSQLMQIAREKNPDSQSRYNIQSETVQMLKFFDELREQMSMRSRKKNGKPQHRKRTLTETTSPTSLRREIELSLRNINDQLILWERSGFQSDDPVPKAGQTAAGKADPADVLRRPTRTDEYGSLDQKSLTALLNKRREAVIRSNSSMDGFDHDAERMFLLSLTRDQKRDYNSSLRDFQQQGYSSGQAVRNAVLKTHTAILMEKPQTPVSELIRILQAMDKEEARRLEKNDIKFKLDRSREKELH